MVSFLAVCYPSAVVVAAATHTTTGSGGGTNCFSCVSAAKYLNNGTSSLRISPKEHRYKVVKKYPGIVHATQHTAESPKHCKSMKMRQRHQ